MSGNKEMITAQVLAEELNFSVETIWRYTREQKIPFIKLGKKQYRYKLAAVIKDYFRVVDPEGEIFAAPLDVTFSDITVVRPDLFYIASTQNKIIKKNYINGSPVLVVEIISPDNPRKDRLQKMRIYQKAQVKHYWLANPEERTLECFVLRDGAYSLLASGMDEDIVEHPDFTDLIISLEKLWHKGGP